MLVAPVAGAQTLPVDGNGKVGLYEVVRADSLRAGALHHHAKSWLLGRGYAVNVADSAHGRLEATHSFGVYDRGYITKKLHGKVNYHLLVEVKDGRYRVQFHDFVFAYYREDRSYRFVPTGKTKPLEETTAPGWQKLWETHRHDAYLTVSGLAAELKWAMLAVPKPPVLTQRPPTTDW
ncbi:MAG: hypothetical protein NVSMB30_30010 [Hymenobacter sp.]